MSKGRFTQEARLSIIQAHIEEFDKFDAAEFEEAARAEQHPAHEWFTWDAGEAARQWRIHEARQFAHIRIRRESVETVDVGGGTVTIEVGPMLVSPPSERGKGGGYILADSAEGKDALREEAKLMLMQWLVRFRTVLADAQVRSVEKVAKGL